MPFPRLLPFVVLLLVLPTHVTAVSWDAPDPSSCDDLRLAGAWAAAQTRGAERMALAPLDDPDFILADLSLQRQRRYTNYSGDVSGRWIGAAAFLAPLYPKPFDAFGMILSKVPTYQKEDGHFGTTQDLPHIDHNRDKAILWGNGRLLIGMVEACERAGGEEGKDAAVTEPLRKSAKALGDYFIETDPVFDRPELYVRKPGGYQANLETYYFQCIEGLVGLSRITSDPRYFAQAERVGDLAATIDNFDTIHSHGRLCAMRGFADLYHATGKAKWLELAERDWSTFIEKYRLPTGGVKEILTPGCDRDEGCSVSDWLRLNLSLWRLTGKARYLDEAERCLKNHYLYQQFANGGAGHRRFHQIAGRPVAFTGPSEEAWWCCSKHWVRASADIARFAVTGRADGISINLMIDCEGTVTGKDGNWNVMLRETDDGFRAVLSQSTARSVEANPVGSDTAEREKQQSAAASRAVVRIHRPAWAEDGVRVEKPDSISMTKTQDAWLFEGTWNVPREITIHLPTHIRPEELEGGGVALFRGYDLLAAHDSPENAWIFHPPATRRPVLRLSDARALSDGRIEVPATLNSDADPRDAKAWKTLELAPLRTAVGRPRDRAWFSFLPCTGDAGRAESIEESRSKNGRDLEYFDVGGRQAFLLKPRNAAQPTPWVWYAPTLAGKNPNASNRWIFDRLLARGVAVAGIDAGESFGSPAGRRIYDAFYTYATTRAGLAAKPVLLAQSRGGLMLYNWAAENPEKTAAVAGIYPVCDLRSYPGLATAAPAYGMRDSELAAQLSKHNPIERLAPLAKAGVPIFHIHGDSDTVVPLTANSRVLHDRYIALNGPMRLVVVPGKGHEEVPEFFHSKQLLDFLRTHATVPKPAETP